MLNLFNIDEGAMYWIMLTMLIFVFNNKDSHLVTPYLPVTSFTGSVSLHV